MEFKFEKQKQIKTFFRIDNKKVNNKYLLKLKKLKIIWGNSLRIQVFAEN